MYQLTKFDSSHVLFHNIYLHVSICAHAICGVRVLILNKKKNY